MHEINATDYADVNIPMFMEFTQFASVYSAVNEDQHCCEGTCDGLVSHPGESV